MQGAVSPAERNALIAVYNSTGGSSWTRDDGWLGATGTECSWYHVTCNGDNSQVIGLDLQSNGLTGSLPAAIGGLVHLYVLHLANNALAGPIPAEIGNTDLGYFFGENNDFAGELPSSIGNLVQLEILHLRNNRLNGPIPSSIGNLPQLRELWLSSNALGSGADSTVVVPRTVLNLGSLTRVELGANALGADPDVEAFLDAHSPSVFGASQTVPPTQLSVDSSGVTALVSWSPIRYTGDGGGYRVIVRRGIEVVSDTTVGPKTVSSTAIGGLLPGQSYTVEVRTVTPVHANNENALVSAPVTASFTMAQATPSVLQFSETSYAASEGEAKIVTVLRTGNTQGQIAVDYAATAPTATEGVDFTRTTGRLVWPAGDGQPRTFAVSIADDAIDDDRETITLRLSNPSPGAAVGSPGAALITIDQKDIVDPDELGEISSQGADPVVAANPDGTRLVVWQQAGDEGVHTGIFAQYLDAQGRASGRRLLVHPPSPELDELNPAVVGPDGFVVTLEREGGDLLVVELPPLPAPPPPPAYTRTSLARPAQPALAASARGDTVVVWQDGQRLVGRLVLGEASAPAPVFEISALAGRLLRPAGAALSDDGKRLAVVWSRVSTTPGAVTEVVGVLLARHGSSFRNLGSFRLPHAATSRGQSAPGVAFQSTSYRFLVVWQNNSPCAGAGCEGDVRATVLSQRFDPAGKPIGCSYPVAASNAAQTSPVLTRSLDGRCVVAWNSRGTSSPVVAFAREVQKCRVPKGGLSRLGAVEPEGLSQPSAAVSRGGALAIMFNLLDAIETDGGVSGRGNPPFDVPAPPAGCGR